MKESGKIQWDCFNVLKFLACVLIINSHCRSIYPLYFLAIGGGHGNGLFFIVSGFFLANVTSPFNLWIRKRIGRIVPVTLLFTAISIFFVEGIKTIQGMTFLEICMMYINKYWFVAAIFLYYFIFYLIFNMTLFKVICAELIYWGAYILIYIFIIDKTIFSIELEGFCLFKVYFYFGVFFAGGLIRVLINEGKLLLDKKSRRCQRSLLAMIFISFILWITEYALMMVFHRGYTFQFLIHFSVFVFSSAFLILAYTFREFSLPKNFFGKLIRIVADSTLEIYLVQVTLQPLVLQFKFPINWLAFFILSLGGGVLSHIAIVKFRQEICNIGKKE